MAEKSEIDLDSVSACGVCVRSVVLGAPWVHSTCCTDAEKIGDDAEHLVVHLRFYFPYI